MTRVSVRLIRTGGTRMPPGYVYRDRGGRPWHAIGIGVSGGERIPAPYGCFLVEHRDYGPILVDTGMHPSVAHDPQRNLGRVGQAILSVTMQEGEDAPARLRGWGIDPHDVCLVLMTHLHADHTSAMSEFPQATFVVAREEWEAATGRLSVRSGYARGHLPPRDRVELVEFGSARPHGPLERTLDRFGDGSVRLVSTPGHTRGHLSVLVETARSPVFLLGDPVYTLRNLEEDVLPWRTDDDEASLRTMAQLRAYAAERPDAELIPTHDVEVWDRLEGSVL